MATAGAHELAFIDELIDDLRSVFARQPVVVAGGVLAGMTPVVRELRAVGAARMLLVATGRGTGPTPDGDDLEIVVHELPPSASVTAHFRTEERFFADPPAVLLDAIRRFCGNRTPLVLSPPFSAVQSFGPFAVFGARRPQWVALEDKTRADDLFDAAAVPRLPATVVGIDESALVAASRCVDGGDGTVWAGDARDGFNGGAEFVRWVRGERSRDAAVRFFAPRCDRVRVSPFAEGVPCSVHGFVTADAVAAFRPVELVTLRTDDEHGFLYAGAATYFDPDTEARASMRASVYRLGALLRDRVAFRGAFTLDGICTVDGWIATECNPRGGAGLGYLGACIPEFPAGLAQRLASERAVISMRAEALEALVVGRADRQRWGGAWTAVAAQVTRTLTTALVGDASGYRAARDGEEADATITIGPGPLGGFVRFEPDPARTPVGLSIAPRAVAAFAFADTALGTAIGEARPAKDVAHRS